MSTVIRSCPGCKSLILSDTDQCPECGHVFYERKKTESSGVAPATPDALKSASLGDVQVAKIDATANRDMTQKYKGSPFPMVI